MNPVLLIVVLSALLGLQPLTTDLFLPALPALREALGASLPQAQATLAAVMLSFGCGQPLVGALADRHGRRPVLVAGLSLYALAAAVAALAPTIELLIAARAVQGLGLAAGVVGARAMVRDLYAAEEGPRVMSRALSGLGLVALVSPVLGGGLAAAWGWRAALASVSIVGAAVAALVIARVPETRPPVPAGASASRRRLWDDWGEIAVHPRFRAWALLSVASYGGLFVFLSASSFVALGQRGLSPSTYGLWMAGCSLCYLGGTHLCRRLLRNRPPERAVRWAAAASVLGAVLMLAQDALGARSAWTLFLPQWIYLVGHGIHQPCAQAGAVTPFPNQAGQAAALSGSAQALGAFFTSMALGAVLPWAGPAALGGGLAAWTVVIAVVVAWALPSAYNRRPRLTA